MLPAPPSERRDDLDTGEGVTSARDHTDALRKLARDGADQDFQRASSTRGRAAIATERASEDDALAHERAITDERRFVAENAPDDATFTADLNRERDHTDRELRDERSATDRRISSRDDFLGIAAHQLRSLLNGLAMSAAALRSVPAPAESALMVATQSERIMRYVGRMNRLLGDLLDVSSIEAGQLAMTPAAGDARDLLAETISNFHPHAAARRIDLRAKPSSAPMIARFDRERVLQVLGNVVDNAIKFSHDGGSIVLSLHRSGDELHFAVVDDGVGIGAENLASVFERFWRQESAEGTGMGLGLYIAKRIVEAHRGRIWAESRAPHGSTVYFTLPAAGR